MHGQTLEALTWFLAVYIGPATTALALTLLVELSVALAMGWRSWNDLAGVAAVSVITNPLFVLSVYILLLIFRDLPLLPLVLFMAVLEVVIVLVEGRLLKWALKKDPRKTILLSAVMNTASFAAGLILLAVRP